VEERRGKRVEGKAEGRKAETGRSGGVRGRKE
jgi:hypothetical protein